MRRAISVRRFGSWPEDNVVATVTLDFTDRHRRRIRLTDNVGQPFLLDLGEATRLDDGDGLVLEDGGFIRVAAAAEAVMDIRCANPVLGLRVAWHMGNRHTPLQVLEDGRMRIGADEVLAAMAVGLGAEVSRHRAPFTPEAGAYHDHGRNGL